MKKILLSLIAINSCYALKVIPVTETACPSLIFTNIDSADTQNELNKKLQNKINSVPNATRLASVNYTNTTTLLRDKDKACKTVTAWIEVSN